MNFTFHFILSILTAQSFAMIYIVVFLILLLLLLIYLFIIKPLIMSQNAINRYHFSVEWGGARIGFMEVTGLDIEVEATTFREGSSPEDHFRKLPGLVKYSDITLKRGIVANDNDFYKWISTKQIGAIERRDITISLLNGEHNPIMVWKVKNAFPVKYSGPELNSCDSGIAIETLVLTHEGLTVETV